MKAFLHFDASETLRQRLAASAPPWLRVCAGATGQPGSREALAEADVLLHVLEPVTAELLACAPKLRLVQKIGVGLNTIDLDACRARGIRVANMPGTNSQAVCEAALALMLAVLRKTLVLDRATRAGQGWNLPASLMDDVGELAGRTVGLLGFGEIPRRLAPVLQALGANILFHTQGDTEGALGESVSLPELLARSDEIGRAHV